jgi:hypothetical protein
MPASTQLELTKKHFIYNLILEPFLPITEVVKKSENVKSLPTSEVSPELSCMRWLDAIAFEL